MRRNRTGRLFGGLIAGAIASALFAPVLPWLTTGIGVLLTPVSHPSGLAGSTVSGWFEDDADETDPRDDEALARENLLLRQQNERLHGELAILKRLNADRAHLGQSLRTLTTPAAITARREGEGDRMTVASVDALPAGSPVLAVDEGIVGIVGTVASSMSRVAEVRLTIDPEHRPFGAQFVIFDEAANLIVLPTEPFVLSGTAGGELVVARHRTVDLEEAGVEPGVWALLRDDDWPEPLAGVRVGKVMAIESLSTESGFSRVILQPAADVDRLREVQVYTGS
ncbi:MAG: rod shape-determining protein MreC [Planctomycetota bacterium]